MSDALPQLADLADGLTITHQTGEHDFEAVRAAYSASAFEKADVRPFISDIFVEFEKADLIICRAGATTCAEVAAAGKAAIMVPFPGAADDHQRKNAEALERAGAVRMILQADLSADLLASTLRELIAEPARITKMETAAKLLGRPNAAAATVDLIEELKANV
jgi:UDP-N-acetylglucosamine--N-acetylmuramyl-(pentapeptide) pyrophosphoryl-undecaprenol N-acetylglucosamine transferase